MSRICCWGPQQQRGAVACVAGSETASIEPEAGTDRSRVAGLRLRHRGAGPAARAPIWQLGVPGRQRLGQVFAQLLSGLGLDRERGAAPGPAPGPRRRMATAPHRPPGPAGRSGRMVVRALVRSAASAGLGRPRPAGRRGAVPGRPCQADPAHQPPPRPRPRSDLFPGQLRDVVRGGERRLAGPGRQAGPRAGQARAGAAGGLLRGPGRPRGGTCLRRGGPVRAVRGTVRPGQPPRPAAGCVMGPVPIAHFHGPRPGLLGG